MGRVLFLTCHLPHPPHSGGRRREHELLQRLSEDFDIHLCAVTKTLREDREALRDLPWRHDGVTLFEADQVSLPGVAPQVARHRCADAGRWVRRQLAAGRFDLVHVESYYLWQHVRRARRPATVLAEQNVEWKLYEQRGQMVNAVRTRRAEVAAWLDADRLVAVTGDDRDTMALYAGDRAVEVVPDGADHRSGPPAETTLPAAGGTPRVAMVGNYGYGPSADAAEWLAAEIMPRVWRRFPDAQLDLVGASPPPAVAALAGPRVHVTGRVPAVEPYLQRADVVACPLRCGGGVKVKVLEALANGKAVVTTPVGAQGLNGARAAVRVAESADSLAAAVSELLGDVGARRRQEQLARQAAAQLPSWDDAAEALAACWGSLARESAAAA